jgi:hypothetical protein
MRDFIEKSVETLGAVDETGRIGTNQTNEANVETITVLDAMNATSSNGAVEKLVKLWEHKNAKRALRGAGLSTLALSLAACGSSSEDPAPADDAVTTAVLTDGVDSVDGADIITGRISQSGVLQAVAEDLSTYGAGDAIVGADGAQLELVVNNYTVTTFTAPDVEMSNVSDVALIDRNGEDVLVLDAYNWDDSVSEISLVADKADTQFEAVVTNLVANGDSFTLAYDVMADSGSQSGGSDGNYILVWDAEIEGFTRLDAQMTAHGDDNGATDSYGSVVDGAAAKEITLSAGWEGAAEIFLQLTDTGFAASGPAEVGPLTLDIAATSGKQGEVEFGMLYSAYAATNTATVHDLDVISFEVDLGKFSDGTHVTQDINGNGNVFNIDVTASVSSVTAAAGSATVGDITISDINVTGDNQATLELLSVGAQALVLGDGTASIGDTTVGDVTVALSDGGAAQQIEFVAQAWITGDGDASIGNLTVGDVVITAGDEAGNVRMDLNRTAYAVSGTGDATVGNSTIGDVTISVGDGNTGSSIYADIFEANAYARAGDATVGNLTAGDVSISVGDSGSAYLSVWANGRADAAVSGDASLGNVSVGDVSIAAGDANNDAMEVNLVLNASADAGDATIGTVTVGDVSASMGDTGNGSATIDLTAIAYVDGTGDASIGNVVIGDVSMSIGDSWSSDSLSIDVNVVATVSGSGNATLSNITIGDISMTVGDAMVTAGDHQIDVDLVATADTGNASIGTVTIGDVSSVAGASASAEQQVMLRAWAAASVSGDASIAAATIGDVSLTVGDDATSQVSMSVTVYAGAASGDASVGDVEIGNVSVTVGDNLDDDVQQFVFVDAVVGTGNATLGDVTIGDVSMVVGSSLSQTAQQQVNVAAGVLAGSGDATVGDVTVGDVTLSIGDAPGNNNLTGSLTIAAQQANTGNATVGDVTVGDINVTAGTNASVEYDVRIGAVAASGDAVLGDVTLGDINLAAGTSGEVYLTTTVGASASSSSELVTVGDYTVGNVNLTAAAAATVSADLLYVVNYTGDDATLGNVTYGDITANVTDDGYADLELTVSATTLALGDVTIGDVTVNGNDASLSTTAMVFSGDINVTNAASVGAVLIGDITMGLDDQQTGDLQIRVDVSDQADSLTIGDVSLTVGDRAFAGVSVSAQDTDGIDVTIGDLSMVMLADVTSGLTQINVTVQSNGGDIVIGDITVAGSGYSASSQLALSNLLSLTAGAGDITVGDIDYTGVSNLVTGTVLGNTVWVTGTANNGVVIDTTGFTSVGDISVGDTGFYVVVNNDYTGTITLGNGPDTVEIVDNSVTATTAAGMTIGDISISDFLVFNNGTAGSYTVVTATAASYTAFLVDALAYINAATANTTETTDVYIGKVGNTYYAAVDSSDNDAIDYVVAIDMNDATANALDNNGHISVV